MFSHSYAEPGLYTLNLTAWNLHSTVQKCALHPTVYCSVQEWGVLEGFTPTLTRQLVIQVRCSVLQCLPLLVPADTGGGVGGGDALPLAGHRRPAPAHLLQLPAAPHRRLSPLQLGRRHGTDCSY